MNYQSKYSRGETKLKQHLIKWSIVNKVDSKAKLKQFKLYQFEKLFLIKLFGDPRISNKRLKVVSKCCHHNKYLSKNATTKNDSMIDAVFCIFLTSIICFLFYFSKLEKSESYTLDNAIALIIIEIELYCATH